MAVRSAIHSFTLAHPLYKNASVSFFEVANGVKTSTLATLYAATSGATQLANPQKLNSHGQFKQAVYIDAKAIGVISGISVPGHDTSIHIPFPDFRVDGHTGEVEFSYDAGVTWTSAGFFLPVLVTLTESFTATAAQTIFNLANAYALGANQISVYRNGLRQRGGGNDYTETNTTRITFVASLLSAGDIITVETGST